MLLALALAFVWGISSWAGLPLDIGGLGGVGGSERDEETTTPGGSGATGTGTVVAITDGDTLRLDVDGVELRVRLIGIDTPEVRDPLECFGPEATAALEALAPVGGALSFAYDRDPRDPYDRELMYLYALDGTFINLELVADGYAEAVLFEPNDRFWPELQAAERAARKSGLGFWGACPVG